jgi:hypothetical protein
MPAPAVSQLKIACNQVDAMAMSRQPVYRRTLTVVPVSMAMRRSRSELALRWNLIVVGTLPG